MLLFFCPKNLYIRLETYSQINFEEKLMLIANLKQSIKIGLGKTFSPLDKAILVNSYGRSGSTMLSKSIIDSILNDKSYLFYKLMFRSMKQQAWDIDCTPIRPGFIYKTHDYPPQTSVNSDCKVIYIFADPVNVVFSLLKIFQEISTDEWMREHFVHLKSEYVEDFYSIIDYDTLHLEAHFDSWICEDNLPVAFVRYENLWHNQNNLAEFLNIPLELPPYQSRRAHQVSEPQIVKRLEQTYSNLRNKIYNCKDFFTINC